MDEKELQALYNAMSPRFDVGDWNTFRGKMSTAEQRKSFYDAVGQHGFDLGDYNQYETRLAGVKKKESFDTNPHSYLKLFGQQSKPSGSISSPTQSQLPYEGTTETNNLPSTSTLKLGATDARLGSGSEGSGEKIASPKALGKALVTGAASGISGTLKWIGKTAKDIDLFNEYKGHKAEELATYRAGKWIDEQVKDLVGELTPEEQKNYSVRLASNMGQMGTLMLGGVGSRALGMSEGLTAGFMGAAAQGSAEYENAVNMGATPDQASKAFWLNTAIGSAQAIPVVGAFRKLDKYTGGVATGTLAKQLASTAEGRITSDIMEGAIVNAAQNAGATILTNVAAMNTYDATRKVFDDMGESLATGGIIGATLHGMTSAIREKRMAGNLTPEENIKLDKAEKFAEDKIKEVESKEKQAKSIINHATKVKENLTDKLPEEHHDAYIEQSLREKIANEKAEKLTDPTLIKEQKEIAKDAVERKEQLLAGKKPEEIVTESEQKKIDEAEKVRVDLERLTEDNKRDNEKIDADIEDTKKELSGLDGRKTEDKAKVKSLREKAQDLEIKKKRLNEDHEKKASKLKEKTNEQEASVQTTPKEKTQPQEVKEVDDLKAASEAAWVDIQDPNIAKLFAENPEQGLKEAAQQLNASKGEAETARKVYGDTISDIALKLYPQEKVSPPPSEKVIEDKNIEINNWHDDLKKDKNVFWHGSPSGDMRGGEYGLHIGTHEAAKQALEARIGVKADGTDWNGTEEYGKTKLAGQKTLDRIEKEEGRFVKTGYNSDKDVPQEDYFPSEKPTKAKYGDGTVVPETAKPNIQPVRIKGEMSNAPNAPHEDFKANGLMKGQIKKGTAKRGYYYKNVGEDEGSISAVLPNSKHIEIVEQPQPSKPPSSIVEENKSELDKFIKGKLGEGVGIKDLPYGVETWSDGELKKYPITQAYLDFKKKTNTSPSIEKPKPSSIVEGETKPEMPKEGEVVEFSKVGKTKLMFDRVNKKFTYETPTGRISSPKQAKLAASRITSRYFRTWWKEFATEEQKQQVRDAQGEFLNLLQKAQDYEYKDDVETFLMRMIKDVKFHESILKDLTDVPKSKWTTKNVDNIRSGFNLDTFVKEHLGAGQEDGLLAQEGFHGYDEQDVMNIIKDIIQRHPEGIRNKDINDRVKEDNPLHDLERLEEDFLDKTGLDINKVFEIYGEEKNSLDKRQTEVQGVGENADPKESQPVPTAEKVIPETEVGKPPTEPPIEETSPTEGEKGSGKDKGILNRLHDAKNVPEASKKGFEEKGLKYEPQSKEESEQLAKAVIDEFGIEEAVVMAEANRLRGGVRSAVFAESLTRLSEAEEKAKTPQEKLDIAAKFTEMSIRYDEFSREQGRDISQIDHFYKKSPLGVVMKENLRKKQEFDEWAKPKDKSWKEFFDELKKEPEFEKLFKEEVKEELKKERAEARKERIKKVDDFFDKAKKDFEEGGAMYATIIPPKVITAALEGMKKAYHAGEKVAELIQNAIDEISAAMGNAPWDKEKFRKEWEEKLKEKAPKEKISDEDLKAKVLDRFRKKLKGLTEKQKDDVIRKAHRQLIENGALEFEDFKDIIARVVGKGELTVEEAARMKELVKITNSLEDAGKKMREERTPQSIKNYESQQKETARAARELNDMFYNKPDILRRLTGIMQLNTLGIVSLINNPIYNIVNQAGVRFPVGALNDVADRIISGVTKHYEREYNTFETQKDFWQMVGVGGKEAAEQMLTGLNRSDYTQKELHSEQIRPFKALRDLNAWRKGDKQLSKRQVIDKMLQGTVGIPAEAVARMLNIGDKPQRFAAGGAQGAAFAKALGLKDIDKKIFMEFPREEAYRAYKAQGLSDAKAGEKADYIKEVIEKEAQRSTFQQDNLLNDLITAAAGKLFGGKDTGAASLAKTLAVSPYIKIPTNAFWSMYNLLNPEVALLQATVHGARSGVAAKKGETNRSKLQLREARYWAAHAIVGMATRAALIALIQRGVFVPPVDEDDSKKEREAVNQFSKQGTVKIGNLTISNRWFGQWGMLANQMSKKYQDMTPEQKENADDFYNIVIGGMEKEGLKELENGVFANSASIIESVYGRGGNIGDRYMMNTLNLFTNIMQPATMAQHSRAQLDYVPSTKGDSFLEKVDQNFAQRSQVYRSLFNKEIKYKKDMWGEKIPKGGNILSRHLGISKENPQQFARPLYNDYLRTNDAGFFPTFPSENLNGKKLTTAQYEKLSEQIGQERKRLIEPYVNDMALLHGFDVTYSQLNDEDKKYVLNYLYEEGREKGLEKFYQDFPDMKKPEETPDYLKDAKKDIFRVLSKYGVAPKKVE